MDGDCGYVAAADRVIAPVVRAALHGDCAVVVNGQQDIGCEPVRRRRDHHCWRVSDGADVRIGRYGCTYRTVRMRVSSDTDARIVRHASPEVVSSCVEVLSGFAGTLSSFAGMCSRWGGGLPRLVGTMAMGRSRGLDVNGMGSAVRGMCSAACGMMLAMRGMMLAVCGMCSAVRGMCSAACLADWGKQKKQFRRTASYGWQMGLEPTTFRTTI